MITVRRSSRWGRRSRELLRDRSGRFALYYGSMRVRARCVPDGNEHSRVATVTRGRTDRIPAGQPPSWWPQRLLGRLNESSTALVMTW
jgi:hypothetical protein